MFHSTHPCRKFSRKTICICLEMSLACQQCSFIQNWWQTSGLCIINWEKRRSVSSIKTCNLRNSAPPKQVGGIAQSAWDGIYSSKTRENTAKWAHGEVEVRENKLVYILFTHTSLCLCLCLHIPAPPSTQDTGLLLVFHQGHFFSLRLDTDFCRSTLARTMAPGPFCQLHIAADHRDMQRPRINYFMGNSRTAAETFWTTWKWKQGVESWCYKKCWNNEIAGGKLIIQILLRFQSESSHQRIPVRFQC